MTAVVAVDATHGKSELMEPIRSFLDDWAMAFTNLYRPGFGEEHADELGRQLVADYVGAILLARIYDAPAYIDAVTRRALEQLQAQG